MSVATSLLRVCVLAADLRTRPSALRAASEARYAVVNTLVFSERSIGSGAVGSEASGSEAGKWGAVKNKKPRLRSGVLVPDICIPGTIT